MIRLVLLLLKLVSKFTDLLERNCALTEEVQKLKAGHNSLVHKHDEVLKRVETLENDNSKWAQPVGQKPGPSNIQALVSSVTEELCDRKDNELNVVTHGLKEGNDASFNDRGCSV